MRSVALQQPIDAGREKQGLSRARRNYSFHAKQADDRIAELQAVRRQSIGIEQGTDNAVFDAFEPLNSGKPEFRDVSASMFQKNRRNGLGRTTHDTTPTTMRDCFPRLFASSVAPATFHQRLSQKSCGIFHSHDGITLDGSMFRIRIPKNNRPGHGEAQPVRAARHRATQTFTSAAIRNTDAINPISVAGIPILKNSNITKTLFCRVEGVSCRCANHRGLGAEGQSQLRTNWSLFLNSGFARSHCGPATRRPKSRTASSAARDTRTVSLPARVRSNSITRKLSGERLHDFAGAAPAGRFRPIGSGATVANPGGRDEVATRTSDFMTLRCVATSRAAKAVPVIGPSFTRSRYAEIQSRSESRGLRGCAIVASRVDPASRDFAAPSVGARMSGIPTVCGASQGAPHEFSSGTFPPFGASASDRTAGRQGKGSGAPTLIRVRRGVGAPTIRMRGAA